LARLTSPKGQRKPWPQSPHRPLGPLQPARLTAIRKLWKTGKTLQQIGNKYGITRQAVSHYLQYYNRKYNEY